MGKCTPKDNYFAVIHDETFRNNGQNRDCIFSFETPGENFISQIITLNINSIEWN